MSKDERTVVRVRAAREIEELFPGQTYAIPPHLFERVVEKLMAEAKQRMQISDYADVEANIRQVVPEIRFVLPDGAVEMSDDDILAKLPSLQEMDEAQGESVDYIATLNKVEKFVRAVHLNARLIDEGRDYRNPLEMACQLAVELNGLEFGFAIHWLASVIDPDDHSHCVSEWIADAKQQMAKEGWNNG